MSAGASEGEATGETHLHGIVVYPVVGGAWQSRETRGAERVLLVGRGWREGDTAEMAGARKEEIYQVMSYEL